MASWRRKRQTRLAFNSLPSSTPAHPEYSAAVQSRLSSVNYINPLSQRQQKPSSTTGSVKEPQEAETQLPTPPKSSRIAIPDNSVPKIHSFDYSGSHTSKQSKIDFRNHIGTKIERDTDQSRTRRTKPYNTKSETRPVMGRVKRRRLSDSSDSSDGEAQTERRSLRSADKRVKDSAKKRKARIAVVVSSGESDGSQDQGDGERTSRGSRSRGEGYTRGSQDIGEPETSGDEIMPSSPLTKPRQRHRGLQNHRSGVWIAEASEVAEPFVVSSDAGVDDGSKSESDGVVVSPSKRRRLSRKDASKKHDKYEQEEDDLAEDLDFLSSNRSPSSRLRSSASTTKVNPRAEALAEFKRIRAGEMPQGDRSNPQASERGDGGQHTNTVDEVSSAYYDSDHDHASAAENSDITDGVVEEDEDDFVVEDEDDMLGVPDDTAQLPLQFSSARFAKPKELFKHVVEWMVQKKINPAFQMTDEIYSYAFQRLDDEAKGLTGSKFMSSVWTPAFTRSLKARPHMSSIETGADGLHHCEACNRKSHPATWQIQFAGKPYSRATLEAIDNGEDDDSDTDVNSEDETAYDDLGNALPPVSHVFHLGRTCMENAQNAHTLAHWQYNLNELVVEYLKGQGCLVADEIVKRDSWSIKKKRKFANKVTDEMEANGEVRTLYRMFKAELEAAHEAKGSGFERYRAD